LKIRNAFKTETWKALADRINATAWMQVIDKSISQDQLRSQNVITISDVALLITNSAGDAVRRLTGAEFPRGRRITVAAAIVPSYPANQALRPSCESL
jgi:hypothetical protein